jgi:hypothetical protein
MEAGLTAVQQVPEGNHMLLRLLTLIALASPNVLYFTWLASEFSNLTEIINNRLASSLFLEMTAATFLVAYLFWAKPLGHVRVRWFILMSLIGGVGVGVPAFYWLNKRAPKAALKIRAERRARKQAARERKANQIDMAVRPGKTPSLILSEQSV